jgi:HK97 family phage portal protein
VLERGSYARLLLKNDLVELDQHPLLQLLQQPNPLYGGARLVESLVAYRCLDGNAYTESVGPENRPPRELYSHRPDRMRVVVGTADEPVAGYEYWAAGQRRAVESSAVHHWKTFNPLDDWYGMPPLVACARSVDMNNAARAWNVSLTQNSARPSGILNFKGSNVNNAASLKAAIANLRDTWSGAKNAGRPGVIAAPEGVEASWIQTSFTPLEVSWMEGLKLSAREICLTFNVPSILLGDNEASTYSNYEQARKALYMEGIFPLLDALVSEWNTWLAPKFGDDLILAYNTDAVEAVQEDRKIAAERTWNLFQRGVLTLNEARRALGYDDAPAPFGDQFYWQLAAKLAPTPDNGDGSGDAATVKAFVMHAPTDHLMRQLRAA